MENSKAQLAVGISNRDQMANVSRNCWHGQHLLLFDIIMYQQHCNMEMCKSFNIVACRVVNDQPCIS